MRTAMLLLALSAIASFAFADEGHHHALTSQEIGSVHFQNSCSKRVEADFNRAVALLHSFQYEQSRGVFAEIAKQDPRCAMAEWGIAMTHYHGLWDNTEYAPGRIAMARAQQIAASNPVTSYREKDYIAALAEIYKQDGADAATRARAYEQKMAEVHGKYKADVEAAIFHALALDATAPKTDKTFTNQRACGAILEPIFAMYPHHPGVAHYLIHCYDNPALAEHGLAAARAYARIAPASAHANHMPSHIFTRVGSWGESIASNASSAANAAEAEKTSTNGEARDQRLHAMDYLEYAYLQSGRVSQAHEVLDQLDSLRRVSGLTLTGNYAEAAIPARYTIELGKWKEASELRTDVSGVPWAQALTSMAVGIGSARSGNLERAKQAEANLASLRDSAKKSNAYWSDQIEVQRLEVAAWIAQSAGKPESLALMRSAADLEESMDKHAVTPGAITPSREMLAQMLALHGKNKEALAEYQAVLKLTPNRFNALYGAAVAAEAASEGALASGFFRKLTEIAVGSERPELVTARGKLAVAQK